MTNSVTAFTVQHSQSKVMGKCGIIMFYVRNVFCTMGFPRASDWGMCERVSVSVNVLMGYVKCWNVAKISNKKKRKQKAFQSGQV